MAGGRLRGLLRLSALCASALPLAGCGGGGGANVVAVLAPATSVAPATPVAPAVPVVPVIPIEPIVPAGVPTTLNGRTLVWSDEFGTDGLPDSSKWSYDTFRNQAGWYNGELQYYSNARLQNSSVSGGVLTLKAIQERLSTQPDYGNQNYSSARLITYGKYSFTYGFVEVRAKLPCSQGTWPAIWMLGDATSSSGVGANAWPGPGEIDIMEQRGISVPADKQVVLGTLHTIARNGGNGISASRSVADACSAFHNYQLTWTADRIQIGVDNTVYNTFDKPLNADRSVWPFNQPQYLLLNLAMGGVLGGSVPASFVSDSMQIEYVRVYQ